MTRGGHPIWRGLLRTRGSLDTAGEALGGAKREGDPEQLTELMAEDATRLETIAGPEKARVLRNALTEYEGRPVREKWHWSGHSRNVMTARIADANDDPLLGHMLTAYWPALSTLSHPRLRLGERIAIRPDGITLRIDPPGEDASASAVAIAAAQTAEVLLRVHLSDRPPPED